MKLIVKGIEEIENIFNREFKTISNKFKVIRVLRGKPFNVENILKAKDEDNLIWHPGVYVFYGDGKVWKVGRHLTNSRKRVVEHITAETRTPEHNIKDLENISDAEVILFNVIDSKDYHWVAAVEIYLENELKPLIPSKRTG